MEQGMILHNYIISIWCQIIYMFQVTVHLQECSHICTHLYDCCLCFLFAWENKGLIMSMYQTTWWSPKCTCKWPSLPYADLFVFIWNIFKCQHNARKPTNMAI